MADMAALTRPDTSDMVRVHRVFREGFAVAPQLLGAVAPDDVDQIDRIATYYGLLLRFLHTHHEGEDALLWPRLRERCPTEAAVVQHVADQHGAILGDLATAERELATWQREPSLDNATSLAVALATLGANLALHLDDEERTILPLVEEHLTIGEWAELPQHGMATGMRRSPELMWLVIGLIREQMTTEQLAHMDAAMPEPMYQLWLSDWQPKFNAFVWALRG